MATGIAPQLFRNRQTRQYWVAPCGRWHSPACGRMLARCWQAVLQWATERGEPPQYLLTLTLRNLHDLSLTPTMTIQVTPTARALPR